jgi:23S rRNA pseudouridine2605 synthase
MRIGKFLSRAGLCSRRKAKEYLESGSININGKIIKDLNYQVQEDDTVKYQSKILKIDNFEIWLLNKPKGYICTRSDERDRSTIYDLLPENLKNFHIIGRLDYNSEGLVILTNDGEYKRELELPKNNYQRTYKVRIFGKPNKEDLNKLEAGVEVDNIVYQAKKVEIIKLATNSWLKIILTEGKNREIRKMLDYIGFDVSRLIRTKYGDYELKDLEIGKFIKKI